MKERESGIAVFAAIIMMALIGLCILVSCNTKKTVTETLYVHDTVFSHSTDTIRNERVIHHTDTLKIENEKIITLIQKEEGRIDTLRIDTYRDTYQFSMVSDSVASLRTAIDSLYRAYNRELNKETVKKKSPPWKWIAICLGAFAVCILVLKSRD